MTAEVGAAQPLPNNPFSRLDLSAVISFSGLSREPIVVRDSGMKGNAKGAT
jgi:hypothetical protein